MRSFYKMCMFLTVCMSSPLFAASDVSVTVDGQVYRCSGSGTGSADQFKTYCQCYSICSGCFQQLQLRTLNLRTGEDKLIRTIDAQILPEGPNGDALCVQKMNDSPVCR